MLENNMGLIFALTLIVLPTLGFVWASQGGLAWSGAGRDHGIRSRDRDDRGRDDRDGDDRGRAYRDRQDRDREDPNDNTATRGIARIPASEMADRR